MVNYKKVLVLTQRDPVLEKDEQKMLLKATNHSEDFFEFVNFFKPEWVNFNFSLDRFTHVLMLGSSYNISYGELEWFSQVKEVIKQAEAKKIPFLGICFGMQFLCYTFGSQVLEDKKRKEGGKVLIRTQNIADTFFSFLPEFFYTNSFHTDFVINVPKDFINLGSSENCPIHIVAHQKLPLFGVQFHPEHSKEYIEKSITYFAEKYCTLDKDSVIDQVVEHTKLKDPVSQILPRFLAL